MKNNILKLFCFVLFFGMVSCEDIETINIDPDSAPEAPSPQLLSAAQGYLGWIVDSRLNGQSFLWAQYWTWGPGVSLGDAARYIAQPDDHNNYWFRSYVNALVDLDQIEKNNTIGIGQAKITKAYIYQGLVDHFGDIPFSESLQGANATNPVFDDAESIYASLLTMIDDGIAALEDGVGTADAVFAGDVDSWTRFGNSLKLRILMRQSVTGDDAALGQAVRDLIANGTFLESAPAQMEYAGVAGSENPMFADEESGIGLFYVMSNASYRLLSDLDDPRLSIFYSPRADGLVDQDPSIVDPDGNPISSPTDANGFRGVNQGGINELGFGTVRDEFSQPGPAIYGAAQPVILMSHWETYFLRAEAAVRYGTGENDADLYEQAIAANFAYLGAGDASGYVSGLNYAQNTDADSKINAIAVQKWISMNGTQEDEGWIESRRLDRPGNRIFTGATGIFQSPTENSLGNGVYPSSWLYPQDEITLNSNSPVQRTITEQLFWDN